MSGTRIGVDALMRAARTERPPPGNEQRLLAALGLASPGVALAAPRASLRARLRWWGVGSLLGVAALASAGATRGLPGGDAAAGVEPPAVERTVLVLAARASLEGRSQPERAPAGHGPAARAAPPAADHPDDELARIREARLALVRHDPEAALVLLDAHARAFPRAVFAEEAAALRVEALIVAHRTADARRATEAFDVAHPASAYRPRIEALWRRAAER